MVRITAVHLDGGQEHEHIASVRWINDSTGKTGQNTTQEMVDYLEKGNRAVVGVGTNQVEVGVVKTTPKHIRTYADGKWTNNLLALPRY